MDYQEFNGIMFKQDCNTGYFYCWMDGASMLMHRYVWEFYNGKIPESYHIHHKDGNKGNNSIDNLECILASKHLSEHVKENMANGTIDIKKSLVKAREAAKIWHGSDEGRKWHSEHGKKVWENMPTVTKVCECCGKEYEINISSAPHTRFCSNRCKSKWRRDSGLDDVVRKCVICGKEFVINKYSKAVTCSRDCGGKLSSKTKTSKK